MSTSIRSPWRSAFRARFVSAAVATARATVVLRCVSTVALLAVASGGAARTAVDANTATLAQLDALSGIGPKIAQRILDERRSRPFRDLEDFQERVRGIGPATLKKLTGAGLAVGASGTSATAGSPVAGRASGTHPGVIEIAPPPRDKRAP